MLPNTPVQGGLVPRCASVDASADAAESRAQPARLPRGQRRARAAPSRRGARAQGRPRGVRSCFVTAAPVFTYSR